MTLHFPSTELPAAGSASEVAPGVRWLRMRLPFKLDHINLWLIADGDGWCIVDTGFADDDTRAAWSALLRDVGGCVSRIIVTHFHPDHLGLATWLMEKTGAPLHMTTGEFLTAHAVWNEVGGHGKRFLVEQFRQHGLTGERLAKYETRGSGYRQSVPALPDHYRRIGEGSELRIGGRVWRVMVGHGHCPEHAALWCEELKVFISGDMLLPKISTNISVMAATPCANSLHAYLSSLERYAYELPGDALVLPSHGLPFVGIRARVEALKMHHRERLAVVEQACSEPRTAAELLPVMLDRGLDAHQTMFAVGETIAHLNYLEETGALTREVDPQGIVRFSRRDQAGRRFHEPE